MIQLLLSLSSVGLAWAAKGSNLPRPADPYLSPSTDSYNPLRYIASNTLTAIAFSLILLVAFIQTWCIRKYGGRFMLSMTIGCYTFALGISTRFGLNQHPESKGLYIVEYLFVVLSPCAFIASEYVLLGRLARYLGCDRHLVVSPRRITVTFLMSDLTTFLIQAAGGSVSIVANDLDTAMKGSRIFLAGLALQLLSFSIFTCVFCLFLWRVYSREPGIWSQHQGNKWTQDWRTLAYAMVFSCVGVMIRSVYRTIELSEGFGGPATRNEALFYGLDTLPLFLAIVAYTPPFWPGQYIPSTPTVDKSAESGTESPITDAEKAAGNSEDSVPSR